MVDVPPLVILVSGNGSNLQAFIDAIAANRLPARIAAVISNNPGAYALERAKSQGIPTEVVDHRDYASREAFDSALSRVIDGYQPELIVLAGFMRILTSGFVQQYHGKLINIHPSLLPKYKGLNTHQRALDNNDLNHGCSVHFVTPTLDGGPVISQGVVAITANDTAATLAAKVQEQEHLLYPKVCAQLLNGDVELQDDNIVVKKR